MTRAPLTATVASLMAGILALIADAPTPAGVAQLRRGFANELIRDGGVVRAAVRPPSWPPSRSWG